MRKLPEFPLTVFYDGSCRVCSKEMYVYQGMEHGGRLEFVDISDPDFNPDEFGISLADFMLLMHAIDRKGTVPGVSMPFWPSGRPSPVPSGAAFLVS